MRNGTFFEWVVADPNLLLQRTLRECPNLAELYAQKLRERPCDVNIPWSLIVVFDAFTPASLSCPRPANVKTMNLAFNFLELGSSALCVDATWLLPVSVRNEMVEEAVGGWSACLAIYLRAHLLGGTSIQFVGVPFSFDGTWYTRFAALRLLSSDGEGLKFALDLKGYNGIIPCISCANVLKKDSGLAHRRPNFVEITCWDHSKFIPTAREDFEDHVDEIVNASRQVRAGAMYAARLEELQIAYGIKANPSGLIACRRLRRCFSVLEVIREDWMHGALEDGTLYVSCQCLLVRLKAKLGWGTDRLERFLCADWDFPKATARKMRNIWHIFDSYARSHMDNRIKFKSTASELLGMYVLLRHWVLTVVCIQPVDFAGEIDAFRAQCRVIDLIMTLKKGFADQTCSEEILAELQAAIDVSLRLHIATYGTETVRPKHHRMHHIPLQIALDKWVVDAFTMERLHLVVKEFSITQTLKEASCEDQC